MSNLPIDLTPELASRLSAALDIEGKLVRALEALGPVADRDVALLDAEGSSVAAGLVAAGARLRHVHPGMPFRLDAADGSADVVVSLWSGFRGVDAAEMAEVDRVLRDGGRLLIVHDYGRDDVSRLRGDRPEYGPWSHRGGPFLAGGFRVRVLHCFWTFASEDDVAAFLAAAFGEPGAELAAALKRPRLSYNIAVYHRSRGATADRAAAPTAASLRVVTLA